MKSINYILLLFVLLFTAVSCDDPVVEKPENLIKRDKMIDMMVDMHLAEATYQARRYEDTLLTNSSSTDFYYSVLQDYEVPDSVFEKSYVFYASKPKDFEKMYQDVMNKLNEMEQQFTGRKAEELDLGKMKKK